MATLIDLFRRYILKENYYTHGNILLERERLLYFPIPKVASSSIKMVIANHLHLRYGSEDPADAVHESRFPFARRADLLAGKYNDYFSFAVVRNPWDRLYSCYCSKILQDPTIHGNGWCHGVFGGFAKYGAIFYATMSFAEFVDAVSQIPDDEADEHFRSQYVTLVDNLGQLIPRHVGRLKTIDATWKLVQTHLGATLELPCLMVSQYNGANVYDKRLVNQVSERYARDIELFGFTFEDSDAATARPFSTAQSHGA